MEPPPPSLKASGTLSERENMEVEVISEYSVPGANRRMLTKSLELLISSYYNIVKRTMIDMVPKAIMLNLVQYVLVSKPLIGMLAANEATPYRYTKTEMQKELLENMYRATELDDLLKESDYTIRRRKECQQMVESLSRASEIVSQVQ